MTSIYVPSPGPDAWKQFLAKPDLHWVRGYSARTLAHCWEACAGLPREIARLFEPLVGPAKLLLAIPEHKVHLPPKGSRESQCDVFALIRGHEQTVACAIEGKVDEPFGPTLGEWLIDASKGKRERLAYITKLLGLPGDLHPSVRHQLLHRTAAAVMEAERFMTGAAAMIVHSFSSEFRWLDDFSAFIRLFGVEAAPGTAACVCLPTGKSLYLGWATGDQRFRHL